MSRSLRFLGENCTKTVPKLTRPVPNPRTFIRRPIELLQGFAFHLQFHVRVLLEHLRIALPIRRQQETDVRRNLDWSPLVHVERLRSLSSDNWASRRPRPISTMYNHFAVARGSLVASDRPGWWRRSDSDHIYNAAHLAR